MRSSPANRPAFTRLEVIVVAAILALVILAILPAFRSGDREQHFRLQPRVETPATPKPEIAPIRDPDNSASPAVVPPRELLR